MKTIILGPPGTGKTTTLLNLVDEFIKDGDYITRIKKSGKIYYSIDCIKATERFDIQNEPDNNEYCIDSD